ncbi:MAG: DegT/DnrJ/EryC1/StrS family aminotransferase [Moheibacter sp.]
MINVTKTFLPPIEEYTGWVQKAFDKFWLTNRGELVLLLEQKLKEYLGVDWITITNNGTVPLQIAVKLLGKRGEIITTPFSFVATTSSIVWENCTPVFVDIHPEFLTIDETKIEAAITEKTTCILATHVFGNPCDVDAIERIAKKHNLKVIYDAAHCFGVNYNGKSVFNYGDISTCSFHATKIFHTGEGGALFSNDKELRLPLYYSHNFGQITPIEFYAEGINAKISELQAAMGLSVFPYMNEIISERKKVVEKYDQLLDFSKLQRLKIRPGTDWNYSYYPVLFGSEELLLEKVAEMNKNEIFPRRYFYPSLNTIPFANGKEMPVSEDVSKRVLSLPLYVGLEEDEIKKICDIINS